MALNFMKAVNPNFSRKCFRCKSKDHMVRDCPRPDLRTAAGKPASPAGAAAQSRTQAPAVAPTRKNDPAPLAQVVPPPVIPFPEAPVVSKTPSEKALSSKAPMPNPPALSATAKVFKPSVGFDKVTPNKESVSDVAQGPSAALSANSSDAPRCQSCGKTGATQLCSGCHIPRYCSESCQRSDWNRWHKPECPLLSQCSQVLSKEEFEKVSRKMAGVVRQPLQDLLAEVRARTCQACGKDCKSPAGLSSHQRGQQCPGTMDKKAPTKGAGE